jgi:hypothetical protein
VTGGGESDLSLVTAVLTEEEDKTEIEYEKTAKEKQDSLIYFV